jgi:biotin-dependent carboxylase-like uncharacterized protein
MKIEVLEVLRPGLGMTVQARPRLGWKQFGVPPSGPMDDHAASWANRLLDNPPDTPLLELLLQGARLRILEDTWIAVTGADASPRLTSPAPASGPASSTPASSQVPGPLLWHAVPIRAGSVLEFPENRSGVWTYVAVAGGFAAELFLGSASSYAPGSMGSVPRVGTRFARLGRPGRGHFAPERGVASRLVPALEQRNYLRPPVLQVWPGPQSESFSAAVRATFFAQEWTVSPQSDRVGYRLLGEPLVAAPAILSEPVRMGTIQVPEGGLPIVTLRDGPTVGGYPKLGMLEPADVSWLVQCRPGQTVRFRPGHEMGS